MNNLITILLATYNGEKYIREQLESLLNQTYKNWHLIIRDDNSTDNTYKILKEYKDQYAEKITIIDDNCTNLGSVLNFNALFKKSINAEYIMFCDQDDKWMDDKIEATLRKMQEMEMQFGQSYPLLVFTDFMYVDEDMKVIESKRTFTVNKLDPIGFLQILVQNPVYGCTLMINKALAVKVKEIPPQAENHDYWIALVGAAFGKIYYFPKKTIYYRQHSKNVSGNYDDNSLRKRLQRVVLEQRHVKLLKKKKRMLMKFKEEFHQQLDVTIRNKLNEFLDLYHKKSLFLVVKNIRNGIKSQTKLQTIFFYTSIFFYRDSDNQI